MIYVSSSVQYSEEKFLVCTNPKCGIIYKEVLDHSAEWRYYGAGDNKMSDPTRCGIPIDPLIRGFILWLQSYLWSAFYL